MAKEAMYLEIYNEIKKWIYTGKYKNGDLLPTEMELSEQFFTSRITIQRAMQMLTADGYVKRIAGRGTYVQFGSSGTDVLRKCIGVILCNVASSFGVNILVAIEKQAALYGYSVVFKNSLDSAQLETKAIDDLVAFGAKGIIIQPIHGEYYNERIIQLHLNKYPIILVDRHLTGFPIPSVSTDNITAAKDATEYLFSRGHRDIGFVCFHPQNTSSVDDRLNGFKSAFIMNKLLITESNILSTIQTPNNPDDETVRREDINNIKQYLETNKNLTCLFASEFTVAQLICTALAEMGKIIPDDYSLMMFDEAESIQRNFFVTHVRQDQSAIGQIAVDILIKKLADEITSDKIYVPYTIVEGSSVAKPRN